jgi:hypothetical protein
MFCNKCGTKAFEDAVFCQKCGERVVIENTSAATPNIETRDTNITETTPIDSAVPTQNNAVNPSASKKLRSFGRICSVIGAVALAINSFLGLGIPLIIFAILLIIGLGSVAISFVMRVMAKSKVLALGIIGVIAVAAIVIVASLFDGNSGFGNLLDSNNRYVRIVMDGSPDAIPNISYGEAFNNFFGTPRWTYFKSDDGRDIVEFIGDCTYQGVPVTAMIQFVVDGGSERFEAIYLEFNGVPQNILTLAALIDIAFEGVNGNIQNSGVPIIGEQQGNTGNNRSNTNENDSLTNQTTADNIDSRMVGLWRLTDDGRWWDDPWLSRNDSLEFFTDGTGIERVATHGIEHRFTWHVWQEFIESWGVYIDFIMFDYGDSEEWISYYVDGNSFGLLWDDSSVLFERVR